MFIEPAKAVDNHNMGTLVDTNAIFDILDREYYVLIPLYMNEFLWRKYRELPIEQFSYTPR